MAELRPFYGIRYNPGIIKNLSDVATPPYDVISKQEQKSYYERHPQNIIRLDKNMVTDQDTPDDNPYSRAAGFFEEWQKKGILIRDPEPAIYATTVEFSLNGEPVTRFGLVATVRLEPFSAGVILPHEQTYSKVKSERLELMKACHANFSHIFSIYSDPDSTLAAVRSNVIARSPDEQFTDDAGHRHKLWRIVDPEIHGEIATAFGDRRLYIADGHHRYETALNYRDWVRETMPEFDETHPANYIMMYLCAMEDPGLVILPTHRLLPTVSDAAPTQLLERAAACFDIQTIPVPESDPDRARRKLLQIMENHRDARVIGLILRDQPAYHALVLKNGVMAAQFGGDIPEPLLDLDVTVLTRLVLVRLMGFDQETLDDASRIDYTSRDTEAVDSVRRGEHDIAFILNPPTNEQVRRVAEAGLTMPRKTTFFYPKVVSGQVMNKLG